MMSKALKFTLILIAALAKPRAWVLGSVSFFALTSLKWVVKGQSIFIDNWYSILMGMINPNVPIEQKLFLVGFFCLLSALSLILINTIKNTSIQLYIRFGIKPEL